MPVKRKSDYQTKDDASLAVTSSLPLRPAVLKHDILTEYMCVVAILIYYQNVYKKRLDICTGYIRSRRGKGKEELYRFRILHTNVEVLV